MIGKPMELLCAIGNDILINNTHLLNPIERRHKMDLPELSNTEQKQMDALTNATKQYIFQHVLYNHLLEQCKNLASVLLSSDPDDLQDMTNEDYNSMTQRFLEERRDDIPDNITWERIIMDMVAHHHDKKI